MFSVDIYKEVITRRSRITHIGEFKSPQKYTTRIQLRFLRLFHYMYFHERSHKWFLWATCSSRL